MEAQDFKLLLQSRAAIVVIETFDEMRALDLVRATGRKLGIYSDALRWSVTEGVQPLGYGVVPKDGQELRTIENALEHIKARAESELYVFCDAHPYLDDPKVIRLFKDIALHADTKGQKLVLISHELNLPAEISRLSCKISLALPSEEEIKNIVREEAKKWQSEHSGGRVRTDAETLAKLVKNLSGVPHQEVRRLAHAAIADDGALTEEDLPELARAKFALMNMDDVLHFEYNSERFSNIAGLTNLKQWLADRADAMANLALSDAPKGVMLLGVQGAGKSLAAKCIAGAWGLPLLCLDFASLYNKYIGETEKNLREALKLAELMSPCVLWIDEIEKGLASDNDQGVGKRILGSLLTWMNDRSARVFLVATSNDISELPAELLRKGRFDEVFFVDLPDAQVRQDIFKIHFEKRGICASDFKLARLAELTQGFSGAEIEQLIVSAMYSASAAQKRLTQNMLETGIHQTQPLSVLRAESVAMLRAWADKRAVLA